MFAICKYKCLGLLRILLVHMNITIIQSRRLNQLAIFCHLVPNLKRKTISTFIYNLTASD